MDHPHFEVVTTTAGAVSIRNKILNEIMHNPVGPWAEANSLYIEQSHLSRKLSEETVDEFVIFDVGLGAAANALAAIHCYENVKKPHQRPLVIVSYEKDLELLRFALEHHKEFEHFLGHEDLLREFLEKGCARQKGITWILRHGDFLDEIEKETYRAHLVFFDPYSPLVNLEMWSVNCFTRLRQHCRNADEGGSELYTYSMATPIRVALLLAGFYVGHGKATGLKDETTQAATRLSDIDIPLSGRWLERWKKSQSRFPYGDPMAPEALARGIFSHPQFQLFSDEILVL